MAIQRLTLQPCVAACVGFRLTGADDSSGRGRLGGPFTLSRTDKTPSPPGGGGQSQRRTAEGELRGASRLASKHGKQAAGEEESVAFSRRLPQLFMIALIVALMPCWGMSVCVCVNVLPRDELAPVRVREGVRTVLRAKVDNWNLKVYIVSWYMGLLCFVRCAEATRGATGGRGRESVSSWSSIIRNTTKKNKVADLFPPPRSSMLHRETRAH
ncbi:hypothetical protein B0J11DRAFT_527067 [Dendryphion nanum]|uniref:Uncharacterized protein n=1 Tax=Dendryphion nanum TaxID=256645 RepID=A0A9P9DXF6_9PLEO|nr:hypothetical protein B0J11DRAFT_527067 [Dendryphion nanum]